MTDAGLVLPATLATHLRLLELLRRHVRLGRVMQPCGAPNVVVSMGCGDTCPILPGRRYLDWPLEDPADKEVAMVR